MNKKKNRFILYRDIKQNIIKVEKMEYEKGKFIESELFKKSKSIKPTIKGKKDCAICNGQGYYYTDKELTLLKECPCLDNCKF